MERTLIKVIDICRSHEIETTFVHQLSDSGLVNIIIEQEEEFLDEEDLRPLEQFVAWHYELELNLQGIEVAQHLLQQIETLQDELKQLRKLSL